MGIFPVKQKNGRFLEQTAIWQYFSRICEFRCDLPFKNPVSRGQRCILVKQNPAAGAAGHAR